MSTVPALKIGQRVVTVQEVERYPDGIVPVGVYGRVVQLQDYGVYVQLEKPVDGFKVYDNCVHFYGESFLADGFASKAPDEAIQYVKPVWSVEFPDFDYDLSFIPAEFEDVSWHNNAMPSFCKRADGVEYVLWCNYASDNLREIGGKRFEVVKEWNNSERVLFSSDDAAELLEFLKTL